MKLRSDVNLLSVILVTIFVLGVPQSGTAARLQRSALQDVKSAANDKDKDKDSNNEIVIRVDPQELAQLKQHHVNTFYLVLSNSKNIRMDRFESAWNAIPGCKIEERAGSAIAFFYRDLRVFLLHRPHPDPTLYPALVKRAKAALIEFGITESALED